MLRAAFARLLPRPDEKAALTNILALLGLPLLGFLFFGLIEARTYHLELPVLVARATMLSAVVDLGESSKQDSPMGVSLPALPAPQWVRFEFPLCQVDQLVLHASAEAAVAVGAAEFHSAIDEWLGRETSAATFPAADFRSPNLGSGTPAWRSGLRTLAIIPGTAEAALALPLAQPLVLRFNWAGFGLAATLGGAEYLFLVAATFLGWRRLRCWQPARGRIDAAAMAGTRLWEQTMATVRAHPSAAIWVAAACGVAVSCYPVIFFGKSFVSPNIGTAMLYDAFPALPGYTDKNTGDPQGADVLATMSSFVPYAMVQRHSLLVDHEFPFLDRYNQCGLPLLAQGQTMIGDPLHLLMLLAGANAWAWDLRFLLSRLLFAAGIGLLVRFTARQTAVAMLLAFAACFIGFFQYRLNHPTYFCLCYAPWILYAWLRLADCAKLRDAARWIGLLLLADWMELNGGPVKDAYLLAISLNLCGVLVLLLSATQPWSRRWRVLGLALWCEATLGLVSNPLWVTSIDLVVHSWNIYLTPRLWQIQPSLLIGFFDDIFYRQFEAGERTFAPCTNFVVFLGLAFAASYGKALLRQRVFVALSLSILPPFAMTFGVISPALIERIPFLGNVLHVDDVFTTILIVPVFVLAGFGLAEGRRRAADRLWHIDYLAALAVPVFLFMLFLGTTQAEQRSAIHDLGFDQEVAKSFFFWCDAAALIVAFAALPLLWRRLARPDGWTRWGLAPWVVLCLVTMLWRHGQQLHFAPELDRYVARPQVRVDFSARSPAVDFIQQRLSSPGRVLGMGSNLYPGVSGMFGLEGISGSDALLIPAYHALLAAELPFVWGWRMVIDKATVHLFKAMYDMLNVRYYVGAAGGSQISVPGISGVARRDLDVFESRDVWPRAFYSSTLSPVNGPREFLAEVGQNDGRPFAVREANWPSASLPAGVTSLPEDQSARLVVPATNYRLTDNTTTFQVHAPGPGVVVLTEVYDGANKQVTVNGRTAPHFPVNLAFEGIYLDHAGVYTVSVRPWPRYLTGGLYVSALGVLLLLGTVAVVYWPVQRAPRPVVRRAPADFAVQLPG